MMQIMLLNERISHLKSHTKVRKRYHSKCFESKRARKRTEGSGLKMTRSKMKG